MKYVIVVDFNHSEKGIIINALNDFRNKLINENIDTEPVDSLLLKILNAPEKKKMFSKHFLEVR